MARTPFEDLVHSVNNLLGTVEVQCEVARGEATLAACQEALGLILESARRTQAEVRRLRGQVGAGGDG